MSLSQLVRKVVRFTNISDSFFEATHAIDNEAPERYSFAPGASEVLPYPIARHLARALARRIKLEQASIVDPRQRIKLYSDEDIAALIAKMITEVGAQTEFTQKTQTEQLRELRKEWNSSTEPVSPPPTETDDVEVGESVQSKGEIMEELTKRGVKVDARKSKSTLLADLQRLEPKE